MLLHDTIAAIATPLGESGIGVIRISGPDSLNLAYALLRTKKGLTFPQIQDHQLYYGNFIDPLTNQLIDEVLFFYAAQPRSFTAEDTVEIQTHGSMFLLQKVLEVITANGARLANPGEFTQRAFLNGRIDLIQAEGIIDLIRAKTDKAHQLALAQLSGKTSNHIQRLESELYQILVHIEALLDFPEEGIDELERDQLTRDTLEIQNQLSTIYDTIDEGRKIKEGISVVIAGRPNVGKSSLLNALLQEEKAIVTDIPGTTRDIVEGFFQVQGIPIRLIDTAGLRETANPIEQIGISKAEQIIAEADLVLLVFDNNASFTPEDQAIATKLTGGKLLVVINKTDLPSVLERQSIDGLQPKKVIEVSVKNDRGIDQILQAILTLVGVGDINPDDRPMLSNIRHRNALRDAIASLETFSNGLELGMTEDLLAIDLRTALQALGEITGKNVSEAVIHGIFEKFCIGK